MSTHEQRQEQKQEQGSVGGGWLGTYTHKSGPPIRFEATFSEPDGEGGFQGTILDDHGLGEANVAGGQSEQGIRFSKRYRRRGQQPVSYEGTLADDGRTMLGTWRSADIAHGVWDARRLWSESEGDAAVEEAEEREVIRVREVVCLE